MQVATAAEELQEHVFGNPHCTSPSAQRTETIVDGLRVALLRFFGANPEEYTVGAGAGRLVVFLARRWVGWGTAVAQPCQF